MPLSQFQTTVLQYTALIALGAILKHEYGRHVDKHNWQDPVFRNFTTTVMDLVLQTNASAAANNTTLPSSNSTDLAPYGSRTLGMPLHWSVRNETQIWADFSALFPSNEPSFWLSTLPRTVFLYFACASLRYYWHILLEWILPARPTVRNIEAAASAIRPPRESEKQAGDDSGEEAEVIQRWIAQGRVQRSSLSWWNTFVKWILDLTIGKVCFEVAYHLLDGVVKMSGWQATWGGLRWRVINCTLQSFLAIGPLASLISFIVVPASQRIVFRAGVDLVESLCFSVFLSNALPWLVKTNFLQATMTSMNEVLMKGDHLKFTTGRLEDEL